IVAAQPISPGHQPDGGGNDGEPRAGYGKRAARVSRSEVGLWSAQARNQSSAARNGGAENRIRGAIARAGEVAKPRGAIHRASKASSSESAVTDVPSAFGCGPIGKKRFAYRSKTDRARRVGIAG